MVEQTPNTSYEQLEAMLFALSPDEYEEFFHNFAQETAEHTIEVPSGGVFFDRNGHMHALSGGDYISIADMGDFLVSLATYTDEPSEDDEDEEDVRIGPFETFVTNLLTEQLRPGELEAFVTLCCFQERIADADIGGDQVYVVGSGRDDDEELLADPFEERCMLHADAVSRVILALGKYLTFREQVDTAIDDFIRKYDDTYYPE